ncbi:hypothetical protein OIU91_16130 [Streptomyces sp. NBC_01456]|uniref:hypothetical protein n=1 Tax=unclassified Streptomyces TaxID=2593676 RepID=UPI002E377D06|nr:MULTISPECIES: hypothetical protein [unclassified Streptomyces]
MSLYGRDDLEWDQLTEAGTKFLIERARLGKVTTYTELNFTLERRTGCRPFDFELPAERAAMGRLLGLIVLRDHERERDHERDPAAPRLMLSALVHYLGANDAGSGFYELAKELGLLPPKASKAAKEEFWIRQINALYHRYGATRT